MPSPTTKTASTEAPIINPEADAILVKIVKRTLLILVIMTVVLTGVMALTNIQGTAIYKYHQYLDFLSAALVVIPFFYGTNQLYKERLRIGRDLVEKNEHRQAIAALEPFTVATQRFFDRTGEAHFLLIKPYTALGQRDKADRCRNFVLKKRPGPWANKLKGPSTQSAVRISEVKGQAKGASEHTASGNKPRHRATKSKPKRRF